MLDAEPVGILGLGFYGAGYFAEIFRAGFESVPKGQIEAARMIGLGAEYLSWPHARAWITALCRFRAISW